MTAGREIVVRPPDGPLLWLFPELRDCEEDVPGETVDMRTGTTTVSEVLAATRGAGSLVVPDGPRGRATAVALRSALRRAARTAPRVQIDPALPSLERQLLAESRPLGVHPRARIARDVPFFDTDDSHPGGPVHTRLASGWWGVLPGDVWPDHHRRAWRDLLRERWPDRALRFLAMENHALAGVDLFVETLTRSARPVEPARHPGPVVVGIDGIDGAGKSTHLDQLQSWLEQRGLRVARHKIYRHGVFHDTVTDMTRACAGGHHLHLWPLQRHVKLFDSLKYWHECVESTLGDVDIVLFDRYVQTHLAAGAGRYHHDPYAREMLGVWPRADLVFVLDLSIEAAEKRLLARTDRTVDENAYMLSRFRAVLLDIARAEGHRIMDGAGAIDDTQAAMRGAVEDVLVRRGAR